jgi:Fe2+ transport system protein FeoA
MRGLEQPCWISLADITPGCRAKIASFSLKISPERRAHLQAYGLIPGRWVLISQHSPVTVVRVEHTELALEAGLAHEVRVER